MRKLLLGCLLLLAAVGARAGAPQGAFRPKPHDWPQWQGPERTAVSKETGLLQAWSKGGPPLAWKAKGLGAGYSTPSVAAGRIFTMGNRGKTEYVLALAEKDGGELWAAAVGPVRGDGGGFPGPRCTPTVDGSLVYALGLNGDLLCLEAASGKERWRKDLVKEFGGSPGGWGYTESPLVDGDKLIVTPGGRKATLLALDKRTGETAWTCKVPQGDTAGYASAIAADVQGQRQYLQFLSGGVLGVAAEDGTFLWRYKGPANGIANISTPVFHDDHVFAASAYSKGGGLARLVREGSKTTATEVYFVRDMQNHHGGMVLLDGYLYGEGQGQLTCLEFKSGEIQWQSDKPGKGSIAYADGRIYYRSEGGRVTLVEPNPKKYVEHGSFEERDRSGRNTWAHPVIANGRLYLADQDVLSCYNVKRPE